MAQRHFYTWIHATDGPENNSYIPDSYANAYWNSLIFDVNHRTIWHQGMPFGNVYPGTASYGEVFNDIDNNVAKAAYSHSEGFHTLATYKDNDTNYSAGAHAEGVMTSVYQMAAHVEGVESVADGIGSHAEGYHTYTYNTYSHAEGTYTRAGGDSSHAEGIVSYATGNYSHAEGNQTTAEEEASHAEGIKTHATGKASHSEGYNTFATGANSHAEGTATNATGNNSHAEGYSVTVNGNVSHGEGGQIGVSGDYSHAEGFDNNIGASFVHVEGGSNNGSAIYAHIEGYGNSAAGNSTYSHIEGIENRNINDAHCSHIEGRNNIAQGSYLHVEGHDNKVKGNATHVEGTHNTVNSDYSTVSGTNNEVSTSSTIVSGTGNVSTGDKCFSNAIFGTSNCSSTGSNNLISGQCTYTYGTANIVSGNNSYIFGNNNIVSGKENLGYVDNSVIIGESNTSNTYANYADVDSTDPVLNGVLEVGKGLETYQSQESALGRYNVSYNYNRITEDTNPGNANKTIFSIGIGTSNDNRENAMDVRDTGVSYIYNTAYLWENGWEYYEDVFSPGLYPIATTSYVMRNGVGRRNWVKDAEGNLTYVTAEYFNNYDGQYQNNAYGAYSHAEGFGTYTRYGAVGSHAEGYFTVTNNIGEHATGRYNYSSKDITLFSIGNGQNSGTRSNAVTVYMPNAAKDGILKVENNTVISNKTGKESYTDSVATYIWSGSYTNYKELGTYKGYQENTLYFIEDGDGYDRNDFVTKDDIEDMIEKINSVTDKKLNGIVKSAKVIKDETNNTDLIDIANACSSPVQTSYIWTGTAEAYDKIKDKITKVLSQTEDMTAYLMVKNMQFIIQN